MSVYEGLEPIDLDQIRTYELASRPSKVTVKEFARPFIITKIRRSGRFNRLNFCCGRRRKIIAINRGKRRLDAK